MPLSCLSRASLMARSCLDSSFRLFRVREGAGADVSRFKDVFFKFVFLSFILVIYFLDVFRFSNVLEGKIKCPFVSLQPLAHSSKDRPKVELPPQPLFICYILCIYL